MITIEWNAIQDIGSALLRLVLFGLLITVAARRSLARRAKQMGSAPVLRQCGNCGTLNAPDAQECKTCGMAIGVQEPLPEDDTNHPPLVKKI